MTAVPVAPAGTGRGKTAAARAAAVATHCPYCALQCGMTLSPGAGTVTVAPRETAGSGGGLCQKGWTAAELLRSPERLTTPLARLVPGDRTSPLVPLGWDEALDRVGAWLRGVQAAYGRDRVAVFGGGGLTNEKAYALGKFARVALGTPHIDYNGRFCMSSAAAAAIRAFGVDRGLPFPLADLAAAEVVLLAGSNLAETMPPAARHLASQRAAGGHLIVTDPRVTPTASLADLHLQLAPGTELALALGLLHVVIAEGLADDRYIAARTAGFAQARRQAAAWWPERAERVTGVPAARLRAAARLLASARTAIILTGRGAEQHTTGTATASAYLNLALALGLPGRQGSGWGCLTGQGNGQGGREHGQKADQLPGYRRIGDPAARAHVAGVWGIDPAALPGPGRSAQELLAALGTPDGPRALLVFGSNIAVSAPRSGQLHGRLAALDLLVVADLVLSETAARADVVLPAAQWAEEDGTMTNLEGRVIRRRRALAPPPGARTDLEIISGLAARLGCPTGFSPDPREVFAELRRASAGGPADYAGITWQRAGTASGVHWPCPDEAHPGTPRLFLDSFPTPDGRARFAEVSARAPAEPVDDHYPVHLTTGRILAHYQSGAQTRRIPALAGAAGEPFVEVHPGLAEQLGITDGDLLRVVSRRGAAVAAARVTAAVRADTVFMPFHWGGQASANLVTSAALDPTSRMPAFKACAVRVEKAVPGSQA